MFYFNNYKTFYKLLAASKSAASSPFLLRTQDGYAHTHSRGHTEEEPCYTQVEGFCGYRAVYKSQRWSFHEKIPICLPICKLHNVTSIKNQRIKLLQISFSTYSRYQILCRYLLVVIRGGSAGAGRF